eukprot:12905312-Prorocentrum_lima.AAC.1
MLTHAIKFDKWVGEWHFSQCEKTAHGEGHLKEHVTVEEHRHTLTRAVKFDKWGGKWSCSCCDKTPHGECQLEEHVTGEEHRLAVRRWRIKQRANGGRRPDPCMGRSMLCARPHSWPGCSSSLVG